MIQDKYLLVIMIPCYVDEENRRSTDALWNKDIIKHLVQISDLTLAAPARYEAPPDKVVPIDPAMFEGTLSYLDLPPCNTTISALLSIPTAALRLWRAIGESDIVHVNVGGWPISFGWIAAPIAKLRGKFVLTNIESAAWRLGWRRPLQLKGLVQALVFEAMARFCVNISDLATFTHEGYRDGMLASWRRHRGHVFSASWIDEEVILTRAQAEAIWREKLEAPPHPLRVVFAANLSPGKGASVLLEALKILDRRGIPVDVRMYGRGPLHDECVAVARQLNRGVALTMGGLLDYGEAFFEMLRDHDLLVAPSISDEQPRIIYDCFSQALPVIASDTPGLRQCFSDMPDQKFVPAGDACALADAIAWASDHREQLRDLGIMGLDSARASTHDQMHYRRAELVQTMMNNRRKHVRPARS
ncbi:MAG: glycosyltransferase [Singulisphaera sp.]|nr:glycosyltransferase [Singulisphaera sp.]